jgi:hypothetical protein
LEKFKICSHYKCVEIKVQLSEQLSPTVVGTAEVEGRKSGRSAAGHHLDNMEIPLSLWSSEDKECTLSQAANL